MKAAVSSPAIVFSKSMGNLVGFLMGFENIIVVPIAADFANKITLYQVIVIHRISRQFFVYVLLILSCTLHAYSDKK